jgi:hypothetical protein
MATTNDTLTTSLGDLTNVPELVLRSLLDTATAYVLAPNTLDRDAAVRTQCALLVELGRRGLTV